MKAAVVYYSMSGNTDYTAQKIAEKLGADIIRIAPVKAYPEKGAKKFLAGGRSAVMGETPELVPYRFDADGYDIVIIGTPVWAGTMAPPVKSFIRQNPAIASGRIAIFTCSSGTPGDKTIAKIMKALGADAPVAGLSLIDPLTKQSAGNDAMITEFCDKISQRLKTEQ